METHNIEQDNIPPLCDEMDGNCSSYVQSAVDEVSLIKLKKGGKESNVMPVRKNATNYNMDHKQRGKAYVFNHKHFQKPKYGEQPVKARRGTETDYKRLKKVLNQLDFDVEDFHDLRLIEIKAHLEVAKKIDHSNNDCLLVAVLSHGDSQLINSFDTIYSPNMLWDYFTADKCPSLAGKPKIFIIQACQGTKFDGGFSLETNVKRTQTDDLVLEKETNYKIPIEADFLIVYSTVDGYYSWRNTQNGAVFIQTLCDELEKNAYKTDLMSILTEVARRVAIEFESNCPNDPLMHKKKQVPCLQSTLIRKIEFVDNKKHLQFL